MHRDTTTRAAGALGAEIGFAFQHAALVRSAQLGGAELIFHRNSPRPQSCLCRSQEEKAGRGRREKGRKDGSRRGRHREKPTLFCFPSLFAEKRLIGCKVSTLPGRSLFLPFRVPPAFLLQRLGSCDCSTPLTPRLLWKPMNCLRKVSWQPLHPLSCLPSPDRLGQCRSPLCRQRSTFTSILCFWSYFFSNTLALSTPTQVPHHGLDCGALHQPKVSAPPLVNSWHHHTQHEPNWTASRTADLPSEQPRSCQLAVGKIKEAHLCTALGFGTSPRSRDAPL